MKYFAMFRTADGSTDEVEVPTQGLDAARAVVPEGGQLLNIRVAG